MLKNIHKLLYVAAIFVVLSAFMLFTKSVKASTLTSASVTLSNSEMSFKAPILTGAAGSSLVTITGGVPDTTTNHLFPGDKVCFTDAGNNVCRDNMVYTADSVPTVSTFNLTSPLTTALTGTDFAVASASGTWAIQFTTVNSVPVGGTIKITIPANTANTAAQNNDGMPDSAATVGANGFDMNKMVVGNATVTATGGCTNTNWGTAGAATSITVGTGGTGTVISWTRASTSCAAGSTINIALGGNGIVNPAPITGHVQGAADIYGITVATTDGTNVLDSATPKVAPVEAVFVSGTVDESLSLVITGVTGTHCGNATTVTATATSIPWGHFAAANTFYYAAQNLVVTTNASSGYAVTLQENDQMGRNGNACPGTAPSTGDYTFTGSIYCIRDTACQASACTYQTSKDWLVASGYGGLGYSLASITGSLVVPFYYNELGRAWSAKELADAQGVEMAQTIMSSSVPVNADSADVCYRISIPGTQPSGYYYNYIKYTATATF